MTREEMIDEVIRRFGFEVELTINFARMCVTEDTETVKKEFKKIMRGA